MAQEHPITPPDDLAQPWLSDNYTVREIRAARAMAVSPSEAEQAFATPWSSSTTNPSPITPPPELVTSLRSSAPHGIRDCGVTREIWLIYETYTTSADRQLDACCEWVEANFGRDCAHNLRRFCRPRPPSLKERIATAIANGDECTALSLLNEAMPND